MRTNALRTPGRAPRRRSARAAVGLLALAAALVLVAGCGGSSAASRIDPPVVRNFSPFLSPIDFNTLQQNPTFTDSTLSVSTNPSYAGKIVVFFQDSTEIAPGSVFLGGNPFLGPDPSALQITQEIPGTGNVQIPVDITVETDRIVCQPLPPYATDLGGGNFATNMPDGQYTIGVFKNVKNSKGKGLVNGPVFHSFTVGAADAIAPRVLTTIPVDGENGVGASVPPPQGPPGFEDSIADVSTNIFGPTTPDVRIRFTEGVQSATVNASNISAVDAGAFPLPVNIVPAPGFPKLKSDEDGETLPSNGHEAIWRADPLFGGFPFGTQVQVTVVGSDSGANPSPITDLAGNQMESSFTFQFQTIAPPQLPQNPFPEYAIWWSASDRIGTIDTINQQGLADQFFGTSFPLGVPQDVVPAFTDTISTDQTIPNFDPFEIVLDTRTNPGTCHTWVYVQSAASGQVAIINSRNSVPVALINTPSPGGLACQTAATGTSVLLVTNSSANTYTAYALGSLTPGTAFLNGPLFISFVRTTGNTPRAISISVSPPPGLIPDDWNRGSIALPGPGTSTIMWADFTDGVVNTGQLAVDDPVQQFALGPSAAPNDISMTPCFQGLMFAAISQGGLPGEGKVAYYLAGPGCNTGVSTAGNPDSIVGDLTGFDGPDRISDLFQGFGLSGGQALWVVAESGSDSVSTLGFLTGTFNTPRVIAQFTNVGDNPTVVTTRPAWLNPCIAVAGSLGCNGPLPPSCRYNGTQQNTVGLGLIDTTGASAKNLYICARGAGFVNILDQVTGAPPRPNPQVLIPGIRYVATAVRQ